MLNFEKVVEKFKNTFAKNGVIENDSEPFFGRASENSMVYMTELYETISYWSSVYLSLCQQGKLNIYKQIYRILIS